MPHHLNITITGHVQGVFFRSTAEKLAQSLQLTGFIRNQPDGSVYLEVEGNNADLDKFVAWCRQGPPLAQVDRLTAVPETLQNYPTFSILKS